MFKVQSKGGKQYEGSAYAVDPVTKSLILKDKDDYIIINPEHASSIAGVYSSVSVPEPTALEMSSEELKAQEEAALRGAEKYFETINQDVSGEIQSLFDRMNLLFSNCRWKGNAIVILDEYVVDAPGYDQVKIVQGRESSASSGLTRISRMLEGERRKLKLV